MTYWLSVLEFVHVVSTVLMVLTGGGSLISGMGWLLEGDPVARRVHKAAVGAFAVLLLVAIFTCAPQDGRPSCPAGAPRVCSSEVRCG